MKLLKKLAISTFAFAAFSFIACDNPSTPGVGEPDSPDSPVVDAGSSSGGEDEGGEIGNTVWTYAEEGTVTRVAIDTAGLGNVSTWKVKNIYAYVEDANKSPKKLEPLGGWGGKKLLCLSEDSSVWYVNIPAAAMPTDVDVALILNGSGDQIDIGSIRAGEQKIYKIVDNAATFDTWPVEDQKGALAEGEEPEEEKISGTITIRIPIGDAVISGWENVYVYAHGPAELFGGWVGKKMEKNGDCWTATASFSEIVEDSQLNVIFHNNSGTQFDANKGSLLIDNETLSKVYNSETGWADYTE